MKEIPGGLISYLRTSSTKISKKAKNMAESYIKDKFGKGYVSRKKADEDVKPGHEAIRPVNVNFTPEDLWKIYKKNN